MLVPPFRVVYICGPINAPTFEERQANIQLGRDAGLEVWRHGAIALTPHLNTDNYFIEKDGVSAPDIYLGDLILLQRCDAMLRLSGWDTSFGCNIETAWAKHLGKPIFDSIPDLVNWINGTFKS